MNIKIKVSNLNKLFCYHVNSEELFFLLTKKYELDYVNMYDPDEEFTVFCDDEDYHWVDKNNNPIEKIIILMDEKLVDLKEYTNFVICLDNHGFHIDCIDRE